MCNWWLLFVCSFCGFYASSTAVVKNLFEPRWSQFQQQESAMVINISTCRPEGSSVIQQRSGRLI